MKYGSHVLVTLVVAMLCAPGTLRAQTGAPAPGHEEHPDDHAAHGDADANRAPRTNRAARTNGAADANSAADANADKPRRGHLHRVVDTGPPTPLADLLSQALDTHPALVARRASVQAARGEVAAVGLRPDPSVSLSAMSIPWNPPSLVADSMSAIEIGVSQPLWWPGELAALKAAAEAKAAALEPVVDEAHVELLLGAAELYYDIYAIDRNIEALEALKLPIEQLLDVLTARIVTGKATLAQVERARLELLKVDDDIFTLIHERPGVVARLNALLNRPPASPVRPPLDSDDTWQNPRDASLEISPTGPLAHLDELVERGMQRRPSVVALARQKQAASAEADAARWAGHPRLEVFGSWQIRLEADPAVHPMGGDGTDLFTVGVSTTLPLWSGARADSARDVAQARVVEADAQIAEFRLRLRGEVAEHLAELHHLYNHVYFYQDDLIPQAERTREAALAGLDAGRADFESWLAAQQRLVELQSALTQLKANILKHQAVTRALIGELPGGELPPQKTSSLTPPGVRSVP